MVPTGELLVLQLHGHLLRLIASRSGSHFQGLSQAARCLRQSGQISPNLGKKLQQVDAAYNLIRHITSISVQAFSENIERELSRHVPRAHSMNTHGDYIDYDEDKAVSIKSVTTVTPVQDATDNLLNVIATTPTVQDDTTQSDTSGQDATDNLLNDFATTPTVHDDTTQSDYFTSVELHDDTPEITSTNMTQDDDNLLSIGTNNGSDSTVQNDIKILPDIIDNSGKPQISGSAKDEEKVWSSDYVDWFNRRLD